MSRSAGVTMFGCADTRVHECTCGEVLYDSLCVKNVMESRMTGGCRSLSGEHHVMGDVMDVNGWPRM